MTNKITTETGLDMLRSVSPIYNNDALALAIFEANGKVMESIGMIIRQLKYELYPQNATWTLDYWEDLLDIKSRGKISQKERVQKVLYELNKYFPVTRYKLEQLINLHVPGRNARVIEDPHEYSFTVRIPADNKILLDDIHSDIEEMKPAHLAYLIAATAGVAINVEEKIYDFPVVYPICHTFHTADVRGGLAIIDTFMNTAGYAFDANYPICGTFVTSSVISQNENINVTLAAEYRANDILYKRAGTIYAGEGDI